VIGGGYIGAELAFYFHGMGVKVTVLDSKTNLADREDEEVAGEFMKVFSSIIDVLTEVNIVPHHPPPPFPLSAYG
jgi:pyruvate/2-oxoglutarate dehydrogenase complex dihydrolipoamide dehydrogenase (E3) component